MENQKVSVIIPMYNSEKYIQRAVESVLNQSYQNFEIIVVDDGSNDDSNNIVKKLMTRNKEKIKIITQSNNGVSSARNQGVINSSGEYIAFLDSDDLWELTKLEKQVKFLNEHPEIALVGTKRYGSRKIMKREYIKITLNKILTINTITTSSVIIRRDILNKNGKFNENKRYSEDYEMWLRICAQYEIAILADGLTHYTANPTGLTSKFWEMEKGDLSSIAYLRKSRKIGESKHIAFTILSLIKYIPRIIMIKCINIMQNKR